MATAAASPFVPYNVPVLTQRCGEVYYSLNLDTFFVNCQKCSVEFSLQSSELYVTHIKECLAYALYELAQQNLQRQDPLHPATEYLTKTEGHSIPYVPNAPNVQGDHLVTIKQEDVNQREYSYCQDNDHTTDYDENCESLKQENGKDYSDGNDGDVGNGGEGGIEDYDSDDTEEEDYAEPANPLTGRKKNKVMVTLIEEYKKHPCLWNEEYRTKGKYKRYDAYEAMADAINAKHNQNFTKQQIRGKIVQLRSTFKRVLRNKLAYDKKHEGTRKEKKLTPQLWYFKRFMFIEQNYDWEKEQQTAGKEERQIKGDVVKNVKPNFSVKRDDCVEEESQSRSDTVCTPVNASECDGEEERNRRYTTDSAEHKVNSEATESAFRYTALEAEILHNLDQISTDSRPDEGKSSKSSRTCISKNKSLLSAIVDEYKRRPTLWQTKCQKNSREKDLNDVCVAINERFDTKLNNRILDREMNAVISLYKKSWLGNDEEFKSKMWLAELLTFINVYEDEPNDLDQSEMPAENDSEEDSFSDNEDYDNESPISNKEKVFKIIKFLKEAPILWDIHHPWHRSRVERKKCTDEIITKLSQEHDCHLTTEEFRFQVQFLKTAYIRAERLAVTEKPFFFDEMSFLKPYAKQNPMSLFEETKPKSKFFQFLYDDKPLMLNFIELYKAQSCLWDWKHKDRNNPLAREVAYDALMEFFLKNGRDFSRKRLRSIIKILHSTVTKQRAIEASGKKNEKEPPVWFYEHLDFLKLVPKLQEKICTHCHTLFYSLEEYENHKSEIAGDFPYKCMICNIGFISRSKFAYHQITHRETYKCSECDFKTYNGKSFNVHMRRHKRILAFHCEECGKGFVTAIEVRRHQRTHAGGKKFICEQCGKALGTNAEYKDHVKRHRNQRDFKCDICGMAFFTWNVCRNHMATHTTERQHVCETCGKGYKSKKSLAAHMALHRDEKKYKCKFCDMAYAQPSGLHAHMKKH